MYKSCFLINKRTVINRKLNLYFVIYLNFGDFKVCFLIVNQAAVNANSSANSLKRLN
ncbi:MAG: hypothetical protein LBP59_15260 [Planctomycetaceae bacterium]|nr:hypothetical protein [Planctomycetaceae bacterium]